MTEEEQIALAIQMSMSDTAPAESEAKGDDGKDSKMETEVCFFKVLPNLRLKRHAWFYNDTIFKVQLLQKIFFPLNFFGLKMKLMLIFTTKLMAKINITLHFFVLE